MTSENEMDKAIKMAAEELNLGHIWHGRAKAIKIIHKYIDPFLIVDAKLPVRVGSVPKLTHPHLSDYCLKDATDNIFGLSRATDFINRIAREK